MIQRFRFRIVTRETAKDSESKFNENQTYGRPISSFREGAPVTVINSPGLASSICFLSRLSRAPRLDKALSFYRVARGETLSV